MCVCVCVCVCVKGKCRKEVKEEEACGEENLKKKKHKNEKKKYGNAHNVPKTSIIQTQEG